MINRTTWIVACLFSTMMVTGCVQTTSFFRKPPEEFPTGPVHQIHLSWENRPISTPDVVNNGKSLYGLGARLYLFDQEFGKPIKGDGELYVEMYDASPPAVAGNGGNPVRVDGWKIDPKTLIRLGRKDQIGWGYTLFLPFHEFNPEGKPIVLQAKFVGDKGLPLYSNKTNLVLRNSEENSGPIPITTTRQVLPQVSQTTAAGPGAEKKTN